VKKYTLIGLVGLFILTIVNGTLNSKSLKIGTNTPGNGSYSFEPSSQSNVKYQPGKLIVKFKPENLSLHKNMTVQSFSNQKALMVTMESFGVNEVKKIFHEEEAVIPHERVDLASIYELSFDENIDSWLLAAKLAQDKNVEYAEPRFIYELFYTPSDSLYLEQYHLELIKANEAWDISQGSEDIVIAIVDAGVDWRHPDLVKNVWQNLAEDADGDGHTIEFNGSEWTLDPGDLNGIDDDDFDENPNTCIDDLIGWDVADKDNITAQSNNHGTHVAGMASAATNNKIGVAGIGFHSRIMPVKVASDGQEFIDFGYEGIKYAVDAGADIINMSWGGGGSSSFGLDIINYAYDNNVVLVASAGNSNVETQQFPAAYPHVLSVAATGDYYDIKASFSNFGYWVDLSAPGLWVLSTDKSGIYEYLERSGTSFSSPIVAGVAALVKSIHPNWSADQISEKVRVSCDKIDDYNSGMHRGKLGFGRVNAYQALIKSTPAIRITEVILSDHLGNANNIIEPGESIELIVSVTNYLEEAENVTLSIQTAGDNIAPGNNFINIGTVSTNQTISNINNPFTFTVADTTRHGTMIEVVLQTEANSGSYEDHEPIYFTIAPTFGDHDIGNVRLTLTSFGALGYFDYAKSLLNIGSGFEFPKGTASTLFHGSFMVGTDNMHVSDVAYGDASRTRYDWMPDNETYLTFENGTISDQEAFARYNDSNAENPIGITVSQHSFAYAEPPYDDFIILEYTVENTNSFPVNHLYTAVYMDWDILQNTDDQVGYENELALGYMYDEFSSYYGIALLAPSIPASHRAINNEEYVYGKFTDNSKFTFMTGGFRLPESDTPNDWSHLLSTGPYDIQPNETITVVYALLGGKDLENLKNNALAAQQKYSAAGKLSQISGRVGYFSEDRPVEKAVLTLNSIVKDVTNSYGAFGFLQSAEGENKLTIEKKDDNKNAINGADALMSLQYLAFSKTFDKHQLKTTDVTQDGHVDGGDALAIQRHIAFVPNNSAQIGNWIFSPTDTSFTHIDASGSDIHFTGYLLGDCTGDWGEMPEFTMESNGTHSEFTLINNIHSKILQIKASVKLPQNVSGDPGTTIFAPIKVSTDSSIGLAQFVVEYDSTIFQFEAAQIGSDAGDLIISQINADLPFLPSGVGTNKNVLVQISGGGTNSFSGNEQEVALLQFKVVDGVGAQSPFIFDRKGDRTFLTTTNLVNIKEDEMEFIDGSGMVTPVELISFSGYVNHNDIHLAWKTASEVNNLGFEIERSYNNQLHYETVGFVKGSDTTSLLHQYNYIDKELTPGHYTYRLKQMDTSGMVEYIGSIQIKLKAPEEYALHQNYPNPFNPETKIVYELPEAADVAIKIYDMIGQEVNTLVNTSVNAGVHSIIWNGKNYNGMSVSAGIYFYRIVAQNKTKNKAFVQGKKMIVLR
jgi:serine protease